MGEPFGSTDAPPAERVAVTFPPVGAPSILLRGSASTLTTSDGLSPSGPADGVSFSWTQRPDFHAFSTVLIRSCEMSTPTKADRRTANLTKSFVTVPPVRLTV